MRPALGAGTQPSRSPSSVLLDLHKSAPSTSKCRQPLSASIKVSILVPHIASKSQRLYTSTRVSTATTEVTELTPCGVEVTLFHPFRGVDMEPAALLDPSWWQCLSSSWLLQSDVVSVVANPGAVQQVGLLTNYR